MLTIKLDKADKELDVRPVWQVCCTGAADMDNLGFRQEMDLLPLGEKAIAQIDFLKVHEESFVKTTHELDLLSAKRQGCSKDPGNSQWRLTGHFLQGSLLQNWELRNQLIQTRNI